MDGFARKLVARLLPLAAASVASVAIGASTPTPRGPEAAVRDVAFEPALSLASLSGQPVALRPLDSTLLVHADTIENLATSYPVGSLDPVFLAPATVVAAPREVKRGLELPRPDRWTSLVATLALGAFFFLRRIV